MSRTEFGIISWRLLELAPPSAVGFPSVSSPRSRPDRSSQHIQKLCDPCLFLLRWIALSSKQTGIQFLDQQGILEAFNHPIENGNDHFDIQIPAEFPAFEAKAHELYSSIGIFGDQKAVDFSS